MKSGISAKLFVAILAACALVLAANGVVGHLLFERTFMGYLNEQGEQRMHEILPQLQAAYSTHGDWEFVRGNADAWSELMRTVRPDDGFAMKAPPVSEQTGAVSRLALYDMRGVRLIGNPNAGSDAIRLPVMVQGRIVGWLAMVPFQKAIAAGDVRFYHAQMHVLWSGAAVSVTVAALLAYLLSRTLLRRVGGLTSAIHRLAAGDYATRVVQADDDELGTLARDVNRLADTLESIESNRHGFMADISHELRTPLAVLRAELEAIQDGIRPMALTTIAALQGEVQQLGRLVDDLHELSVTQSGEVSYRFATLDLHGVLQATLSGTRGRFADAGLELQDTPSVASAALLVAGDERRLQQLFANLLENALRYTDRGGKVVVGVQRRDRQVEVTIEDSAPGVAEDKRDRLFERFYRAEASRNRASGGSGLGLAICRNIVQAHHGTIDAYASVLGGLCICVRLPAWPPAS